MFKDLEMVETKPIHIMQTMSTECTQNAKIGNDSRTMNEDQSKMCHNFLS